MAGMYPENEEITIFGEKVQWPGVDKNGKFTNGSFSDPHEPPSFIPAGTINLILDNLSALITKLGGKPDNSSVTQLAEVFTSAIKANTGIVRDAAGCAKVAAPAAADDIARKAEVDAEAQARTQSMSTLAQSFQQAINAEAQARMEGDKSIVDFGDPSGNRKVQVGYAGASLLTGQVAHLAGYTHDGAKLKDVTEEAVRKLLRLDSVDNTSDSQKSVKYATTAGSAKADGGNADTVGGYSAGNGAGMLVPVVAFNVGENAGYIKLGNGLIVQWGKKQENTMRVDFPVVFSKCLYFNFIAYRTQSTGNGWHYYNNLTPRGVNVLSEDEEVLWIAIGI